jgi:hypothetical protein
MPYRIGAKGSYGCSGFPALKEGTNEVMGCHQTRAAAAAQIYAINRSEGNIDKSMHVIKEGDFVMGMTKEGIIHGMVEHIMSEGGTLGTPGSEYALESMPPENPAMSVRIYEEEDGGWEPTAYSIGMMYKDAEVIDIETHSMENESNGMDAYDNSIGKSHSCETTSSLDKAYEGCGCPTCKELNVNCKNCPVCQAEEMKSYHSDDEMEKEKEPNYGEIIQPRSGGSDPSNPRLYARIVQEAKDKFDVYPSAVANSWVVQEYKRRGGTYKSDTQSTTKSIWDGSFDPKGLIK